MHIYNIYAIQITTGWYSIRGQKEKMKNNDKSKKIKKQKAKNKRQKAGLKSRIEDPS